jgi:hypothetical protein
MAYNFLACDRDQAFLLPPGSAGVAARRPSGVVCARCRRPAGPLPVPQGIPDRRAWAGRLPASDAAGRADRGPTVGLLISCGARGPRRRPHGPAHGERPRRTRPPRSGPCRARVCARPADAPATPHGPWALKVMHAGSWSGSRPGRGGQPTRVTWLRRGRPPAGCRPAWHSWRSRTCGRRPPHHGR